MMTSDDKVGGWVKKGQNHDDVILECPLNPNGTGVFLGQSEPGGGGGISTPPAISVLGHLGDWC